MCSLTTEEERAQRRAYEEMPRPRAPACLLRAAWTGGTYANLLSAAGCECDPKHPLQCQREGDFPNFMATVALAVAAQAKAAVVFCVSPKPDSVTVVAEGEDYDLKSTDTRTGEVMYARCEWEDPVNCYLCSPLPGGEDVEWQADPQNTCPQQSIPDSTTVAV